jgi:hypothetical protein
MSGADQAMLRPATLDRAENGGSGSDINPNKGTTDNRALFRPVIIQSAAVLEAVKARPGKAGVCLYGGATADLDGFCARRRPKSTVGAEESLRCGQTKESTEARKKAKPFVAAIRERKNGSAGGRTKVLVQVSFIRIGRPSFALSVRIHNISTRGCGCGCD